jgi:hypothetical protein
VHPLLQETNRLRLLRRFVAGYACLGVGAFCLSDLFARNVLGWGDAEPLNPRHLALHVLLVITGAGNLLTSKSPK